MGATHSTQDQATQVSRKNGAAALDCECGIIHPECGLARMMMRSRVGGIARCFIDATRFPSSRPASSRKALNVPFWMFREAARQQRIDPARSAASVLTQRR